MELSSSVQLITDKVLSILDNETLLLREFGTEIDEIMLELTAMKAFLEDAHRSLGLNVPCNETDNHWIASVTDIAYQVKVIVDEYMYHFNKQQQWRAKPTGFFLNLFHFPKTLLFRRSIAVKLRDVNQKIKRISERSHRYRASKLDSRKADKKIDDSDCQRNWVKNLSESSLFFNDDDLVGIDKAQRRLLGWLMDQELQMTVISVVGMGGLGKTSLAANTFNKQVVKQHFDCCVWITVSQQYVVKELFKSMISELHDKSKETFDPAINVESMSCRDLVETLLKFLQPRRYLIVIDDVWSSNFWQDISIALPANTNGSRILLTTRREDVASFEFGVAKHILPLKPLPVDESWAFFCKKAFVGKHGQCPAYLSL